MKPRHEGGILVAWAAYIERLDTINPGAILNTNLGDGIKGVHQDDKGNIVLTELDGVTYSWKSAVRAGLVKLSSG